MALTLHERRWTPLGGDAIAAWRAVPVAIIGDELNRAQIMQAAIKPVTLGGRPAGRSFAGQALTVQCMVGDNSALHHALAAAAAGDVVLADGRGHEETAIWGGVMQCAAQTRGLAAVVIDGAVRDRAELAASPLPVYCRAVVPAGPHKGFGGVVNAPIQCGGVSVSPGDLVVGDDDGIVVVRPDQLDGLLARCRARMEGEAKVLAALKAGKTTLELLGLPPADAVGR